MPRRAFISLILEVRGNVNADAGIGTRIPLKKIVTRNKEVKVFVSPRCLRRSLRKRLAEKGHMIDPQVLSTGQLTDVGDPIKYIDDDLFGYLAPKKGKGEIQPSRSGPVKVSPLIALHHTEVTVEFGGRFPRTDISEEAEEASPVPFEIETAEWLGNMNVMISERVGVFREEELTENATASAKEKEVVVEEGDYTLNDDERKRRIRME